VADIVHLGRCQPGRIENQAQIELVVVVGGVQAEGEIGRLERFAADHFDRAVAGRSLHAFVDVEVDEIEGGFVQRQAAVVDE
jgi:hypothetical protein